MQTHYRTRQGQLVSLTLPTDERLAWHFLRERSTVIEFREGTVAKRDLRSFVPLSASRMARAD